MLPDRIRAWLNRPADAILLVWAHENISVVRRCGRNLEPLFVTSTDSVAGVLVARLRTALPRRLVLHVTREILLLKQVRLPRMGSGDVARVLALDLDRLIPFAPDEACCFYRTGEPDRASGALSVELAIVPAATVGAFLEVARACGLQPTSRDVEIDRLEGAQPLTHVSSLLPAAPRPTWARLATALAGVLAALVLAGLVATWLRLDALERHATSSSAQEASEGEAVRSLRERVRATIELRNAVLDRKLQYPTIAETLDRLAATLPDGTWLEELRIERGRIHVRGRAAEAEPLIGLLEASPFFGQTRFEAPIVPGSSGGYQFSLSSAATPAGQ